jgi:protein polybromo-1
MWKTSVLKQGVSIGTKKLIGFALLAIGRPTEIPEQDIYVCESVYDEARRQVKKLPREGLKKYSHSNAVTEDEIYFFRRLINPPKVCVQ